MKSSTFESTAQTEFERTRALYTNSLPQYVGTLVLSQEAARDMPVDLGDVYGTAIETLVGKPEQALSFARTFGALKVCVALDRTGTTFDLVGRDKYLKRLYTEVQTRPTALLSETLSTSDTDAPFTYILSESGENQAVEMSLIQALHMLDLAIVTKQFDGRLPNVRVLDAEEMIELRQTIPEAYLRTYGNVRKLRNVPTLLGTVLPTATLEKSGIETKPLKTLGTKSKEPRKAALEPREETAFIGITTAKRPHIGHALLLVKAIADSPSGRVLIELNDQGPRVEQAIAKLASQKGISVEEAVTLVSSGNVGVLELESAYKERSSDEPADISIPYVLTANNAYYRTLFRQAVPEDVDLEILANSELPELTDQIGSLPGELNLFGGQSGMALLGDEAGNAFVIEAKGKLMLRGIFAKLAGKYAMTLVDSPAIFSRQEMQVLNATGLTVDQGSGINVLVDFQNMSGTNGDTVLLESLFEATSDTPSVFVALRKMLDDSICFDTAEGGICPNFASKADLKAAYGRALDNLSDEDPVSFLRRPIEFENVKREYLREVVAPIYGGEQGMGKATVNELQSLLDLFPSLTPRFSERALTSLDRPSESVIPKSLLSDKDQRLIQGLRSANSAVLVDLFLEELSRQPDVVPQALEGTKLLSALSGMGYSIDDLPAALKAVDAAKGIYKVK